MWGSGRCGTLLKKSLKKEFLCWSRTQEWMLRQELLCVRIRLGQEANKQSRPQKFEHHVDDDFIRPHEKIDQNVNSFHHRPSLKHQESCQDSPRLKSYMPHIYLLHFAKTGTTHTVFGVDSHRGCSDYSRGLPQMRWCVYCLKNSKFWYILKGSNT